jgi:hypothetical protein
MNRNVELIQVPKKRIREIAKTLKVALFIDKNIVLKLMENLGRI